MFVYMYIEKDCFGFLVFSKKCHVLFDLLVFIKCPVKFVFTSLVKIKGKVFLLHFL